MCVFTAISEGIGLMDVLFVLDSNFCDSCEKLSALLLASHSQRVLCILCSHNNVEI